MFFKADKIELFYGYHQQKKDSNMKNNICILYIYSLNTILKLFIFRTNSKLEIHINICLLSNGHHCVVVKADYPAP